jgi:hypothetical protein
MPRISGRAECTKDNGKLKTSKQIILATSTNGEDLASFLSKMDQNTKDRQKTDNLMD